MAELRVQCPECKSKMKLTMQVETVRCPKCGELFPASQNQLSSAPLTSSTPTASMWDLDDDEGDGDADLFGSSPTRKSSSKTKRSKPKRSRRNSKSSIPPEQLRKFAFTMMMLGVGAFVLPLVGLQIKGLHAMGPEAQSLGGVLFFVLGGIVLLISFKDHFGVTGEWGFKAVKWAAIGLAALVVLPIGFGIILALGRIVFRGEPDPGPKQIAHHIPDHANPNFPGPGNHPGRPFPGRNRGGAPSDVPESAPTSTDSNNDSPFVDSSSNSNSGGQNTTSNETSTAASPSDTTQSSNVSPFEPPVGEDFRNRLEIKNEEVTLVMKGLQRREVGRLLHEVREAAGTFRVRPRFEDDRVIFQVSKVDDIDAFAGRINFGEVSNIDHETNTITVEAN
ncbi:hypothetical protein KOR42_28770 [Thalassoglobus neptunius]|uniref:Uncharacterized protein n=1 Tax=Thalassoglobus neptunius TaxID=1938619 RepID=A0A5C5WXE9_9PLAN|nr:hypothetical protein [Thalassoglobus neptunius]TWT55250.1 hypothetical protein KOR42_28770 [Thalassoglobus neptunius]